MVLASLMEGSDLVPACAIWLGWGCQGVNKGTMVPASISVLETVVPTPASPALNMKLINLVPPCMSLLLFELLSAYWRSE